MVKVFLTSTTVVLNHFAPYHLTRLCPYFKTPQRPENSSYLGLWMERCTL